jgi:hypothetical protein
MIGKQAIALRLAALLVIAPTVLLSQSGKQKNTLIINGQSTDVPLTQFNGHPYVGLEALATALKGSVSSAGSKFALSLPTSSADNVEGPAQPTAITPTPAPSPTPVPTPVPASNPGFSRDFLRAGIEAMSSLREWHAALEAVIQNGFVSAGALAPYRAGATTNLRLASVAVHTSSDKSAYELLSNAFQMMANLSDKYVNMRANLTYIAPDALKDDSLNGRLLKCGQSLGAMAASGQFADDGTCH